MKLYHGTTAKHLSAVMAHGLVPRRKHKSNWDMPSRDDCVYLTTAYAPYFAINVTKKRGAGLMLVEVETDLLPGYFVPDEDFLEQAGRGRDRIPGDMVARTAQYRSRLLNFIGTDDWLHSVSYLGNCAFAGTIPPAAITRIAVIDDTDKALHPILGYCLDPTITMVNYKFCGDKYRDLTQWFFSKNHRQFLAARRRDKETTPRLSEHAMMRRRFLKLTRTTPRTGVRVYTKQEIDAAATCAPRARLVGVDASQGAGIAQG